MTTRQKLALAALIVVCAAVLVAIVAQVIGQWETSTTGWKVAKLIILIAWLWACWRMLTRTVNK